MPFVKGYKMNQEHKDKIGKANSVLMKQKWLNPEYRANQLAKRKGVMPKNIACLRTLEARKKMSISHKERLQKDPTSHGFYKHGLSHTPEYRRFYNKNRRARKLNAEGCHTLQEWELLKKQYGYKCPCCNKKEPEIKLTEDHIIPLTKGGSNYIENIQPLCRRCNSRKNVKIMTFTIPRVD